MNGFVEIQFEAVAAGCDCNYKDMKDVWEKFH